MKSGDKKKGNNDVVAGVLGTIGDLLKREVELGVLLVLERAVRDKDQPKIDEALKSLDALRALGGKDGKPGVPSDWIREILKKKRPEQDGPPVEKTAPIPDWMKKMMEPKLQFNEEEPPTSGPIPFPGRKKP